MKVALVHEWLTNWAGSEQVLAALAEVFPDAPVFTMVADADLVRKHLPARRVHTSFIQRFPKATRLYQWYLPFMPLAVEQFDLREYDVVISSSHACAKGVLTRSDAVHICYCHTPIRYAWDMYQDYLNTTGRLQRWWARPLMHYLRLWDALAAQRVDRFVANSRAVAERIGKHYRQPADVVHPPVDTEYYTPGDSVEDFYLVAGRLVPYKRVDLAVEAFTRLGKPLVVIGDGPERRRLEALAGSSVRFLGYQPRDVLRDHFRRCRALIFPGEEDFGIVPVEVQACGRPVVAYGRGGALDSVQDGVTGILFPQQTAESLMRAIERAERTEWDSRQIVAWAARFSTRRFQERMRGLVEAQVTRKTIGRTGDGSRGEILG